MPDYYKINGAGLSYAEYWRMSSEPLSFAIAALRKLLRVPIKFKGCIPRVDSLIFLEREDVPARVRKRWGPAVAACAAHGLEVRFYFTLASLMTDRDCYAASFLSEDRLVAANLTSARVGLRENTAFGCLSELAAGRFFITSDQKIKMEPHPDDEIQRLPGRPPEDVLQAHFDSLRSPGHVPVRIDENFQEWVLRREQRHVDCQIVRGVYVRMPPDEVDALREARRRARRDEEL